jgi:hypothetical protein
MGMKVGPAANESGGTASLHAEERKIPASTGSEWARPDLELFQPRRDDSEVDTIPAFAILTTRSNEDLRAYPSAVVVAEVSAGGGILTVVRPTQDGPP